MVKWQILCYTYFSTIENVLKNLPKIMSWLIFLGFTFLSYHTKELIFFSFDEQPCVIFLLLCNKLSHTLWLKNYTDLLSHSFWGSGILSLLVSLFKVLQDCNQVLASAGDLTWRPNWGKTHFPVYMVVGRTLALAGVLPRGP